MLLAIDVHYSDDAVTAAGVAFDDWTDSEPTQRWVLPFDDHPAPYLAGEFYQRELPYLCKVIDRAAAVGAIETVIIDAHVWLTEGQPGLGVHLYEHLNGTIPVVGIAKSPYRNGIAIPITRGTSRRPLHISSVVVDPDKSADLVRAMDGTDRIPTMIRLVDQLARQRGT